MTKPSVERSGLNHLPNQSCWVIQRADLDSVAEKVGQNFFAGRVGDVARVTLAAFGGFIAAVTQPGFTPQNV
jgi:hypothetical protein